MKTETSPNKVVDSKRSWFLLFIAFLSLFMAGGLQLSFGTILSALIHEFGESKSKTAWVGSLVMLFASILSPLSITLLQRHGKRVTQVASGIFLTIGIISTSLVRSIDYMFLTYGVLLGTGVALITAPTYAIIPNLFDKHIAVAMAVIASGNTLGLVFFSFLLPSLLSEVGWRKTLWIIAALGPLISITGLVFPARFIEPGPENVEMKDCRSATTVNERQPWWKSIKKKAFVLWSLVTMIFAFIEFTPLYLMPTCAQEQGIPLSHAKWLNIIFGIDSFLGKLAAGPISKVCLKRDQCKYVYLIVLFIYSISSFLISLNTSFKWLMLYMAVAGLLEGLSASLYYVVTLEIAGVGNFGSVLGLGMVLLGISYTIGTPLAGLFYEAFPQIRYMFLATSATILIATILMAIIPCVTPRRVCRLRPENYDFWRICSQSPNISRKPPCHKRPFTVEDGKRQILTKQHSKLKKYDLQTVSQTYLVDAEEARVAG